MSKDERGGDKEQRGLVLQWLYPFFLALFSIFAFLSPFPLHSKGQCVAAYSKIVCGTADISRRARSMTPFDLLQLFARKKRVEDGVEKWNPEKLGRTRPHVT